MTLQSLLEDYINGRSDAITTIRTISGVFNPEISTNLLALICSITRVEQGDLSKEIFIEMFYDGDHYEGK